MRAIVFWATCVGVCVFAASESMAVPAFPGAEGYGAVATGGRGGAVYEVTNLNDSGTGSLRAALNHSGARTIVFRVSGTIHLTSDLSLYYSNVTIAGQTAPGDGICIANGCLNVSNYSNVIIRYIRCRLGDQWPDGTENGDNDALWGRYGDKIILDHVTASWSIDETLSLYVNTNVTVQWCIASESLYASHHLKGNHGYGGIWGSTNSSWHHNLMAHHSSRFPRIDGEVTNNVDLRNNVLYNWGFNSCYGGEKATVNIVNCYYKYGPATGDRTRIVNPSLTKDAAGVALVPHQYGQWYVTGNYVDGSPTVTSDNWNGGVDPEGGSGELSLCKSLTQFPVATTYPVTEQTALNAYNYVLASAGCSLVRDSIDVRIIDEVRNRTAHYGGAYGTNLGIIDSQTTVGGWPALNSTTAPVDSDHDGMPDAWELSKGLNPNNAADRNLDRNGDGYTNLEEYINSLVPDPYGLDLTPPMPDPMTWSVQPHAVGTDSIEMTASTATDFSGVEYRFICTFGAGHSSDWQDSPAYADTGLTPGSYTYIAKARDKSTQKNMTGESTSSSVILSLPPDVTPPTPGTMSWSVPPYGVNSETISMTATTAEDSSGVEYLFTCTTGGGHSSTWQDSSTYVDTGLVEGVTYTYTVQARDKSPNQNANTASSPASGSTVNAAPLPNPMSFTAAPQSASASAVSMTATDANDVSGVEYYFACTSGGGHDSGWQDSAIYTDANLLNNTTYTYKVIARDKSLAKNATLWSSEAGATTLRYDCTPGVATDLNGDCRVDFVDYAALATAWNTPVPLNNNITINGTFDNDALGWEQLDLSSATGSFWSGADPQFGNPPGAAYAMCDTSTGDVSGHYLYQVVPVTVGTGYHFSGQWMGDLSGDPLTVSNKTQVLVAFEAGNDPAGWDLSSPSLVKYAKVWGIGELNSDPNGIWGWQNMSQSRTNAPSDDVYTATAPYMVVAFSVSGIAAPGTPWIDVDNIKVEGPGCPVLDLNNDCKLDWQDTQLFAADWLNCTRSPAGECGL
jgi:hypothetical protein